MPKPRAKPIPKRPSAAPTAPVKPRRGWTGTTIAGVALVGVVGAMVVMSQPGAGKSSVPTTPSTAQTRPSATIRTTSDADLARYAKLSVRDRMAMSDAELESMDPLVMNMVVAKGVPELAGIDFAKYAKVVDGWADRTGAALVAREPGEAATSPAYKADPDIWRAGGMAMAAIEGTSAYESAPPTERRARGTRAVRAAERPRRSICGGPCSSQCVPSRSE